LTSTETNPCTREIQVEVPADVVAAETESLIQKYQKLARIPGFRRGKVPATVVRQRFGDDLKIELTENLIPRYFHEEVKKQGLVPVSPPRITDQHLHDGEPFRFKATFEVVPEIEVTGYKELQPEHKDTSVGDQDVQKALDEVREQQVSYDAVEEDRPLADGDYAQVSFNGKVKDQPDAEPVQVDEVLVDIGGPNTVPAFSENLRGMKSGEEKSFDVSYAEDFRDSRLAGKTMSYEVKLKGIKRKQLPELNDDFAKQFGEFDTLDALKQKIRESLEQENKHNAEREAKDKIVEELLAKNDFPVPEALVEHQIDLRLDRGLRALAQQGMKLEDLKKLDTGRLRTAQREQALKEVRATLLLERIADLEKIEVSDEEVTKEIEALATQAKQNLDDVKARLTRDGALDRIRGRIREEKTLDFLYRKSA
jgi:trigger factor